MTTGIVSELRRGRAETRPLPRRRITGAVVVTGGLIVVIGTLLPWMTLLGGLHTYRGIIGLYGRLIALGGGAAVALGLRLALRDDRLLRWAAGVLGGALFLFSAGLLRNLVATVSDLRGNPMMLAAPGWGLYVCIGGAALVCASLVISAWRDTPVDDLPTGTAATRPEGLEPQAYRSEVR